MPVYTTVPREFVARLLADHPCTRADLDRIRDPREPSRYAGTYRHVHGGRYGATSYRARVFKFFELGSNFESAEAAARAVVAFYKAYFGNRWAQVFQLRRATPWRVRRLPGGCAVDLFVRGRPVGVTRADAGVGRTSEWLWPTARAAKAAARAAMTRRFARERASLPIPAPGLLFWRG